MRPELLTRLSIVSHQIAKLVTLKDQTGVSTQHAAIQWQREWDCPPGFSLDRVPCQQGASIEVGHGVQSAGGILHRPACRGVIANIPIRFTVLDIARLVIEKRNFVDRDINQSGIGVERHGMPVVRARRSGHHRIERQVYGLLHQHRSPIFVEFASCPVLVGEGSRRNQLTISSIEHIEEPVFGRLHHHTATRAPLSQRQIGQHDLLCRSVIPAVAGGGLVVPTVFPCIRINRKNR